MSAKKKSMQGRKGVKLMVEAGTATTQPGYSIFWGKQTKTAVTALKRAADSQTQEMAPFEGETQAHFTARVWSCGFLYGREYYSEQIALKMAGWPKGGK